MDSRVRAACNTAEVFQQPSHASFRLLEADTDCIRILLRDLSGSVQCFQKCAGGGDGAVAGDCDGGAACKARSVSSDGGKGDADGITGAAGTGQIGQCIEINLREACLIIAGIRIGQRLPAFC